MPTPTFSLASATNPNTERHVFRNPPKSDCRQQLPDPTGAAG